MAALKLRPVRHVKGDANRFCGPSVISALTGMNSGEAARLLRHVSRKASIKGASTFSVRAALRLCNVGVGRIWRYPGGQEPTLAAWLRATHGERGGRVFLIVAGNHFQAVSGNRFVCGQTLAVVGLDHPKVKRRARVDEVLELQAPPSGLTIPAEARKPKAKPSPHASARTDAQRLAKRWGIEIEQESRIPGDLTFWVYGPGEVYLHVPDEDDPCCGEHFCCGWSEVLDKVETYVADLEKRRAARAA